MPASVKDLVNLYDSPKSPTSSPVGSSLDNPSPRPARFLHHHARGSPVDSGGTRNSRRLSTPVSLRNSSAPLSNPFEDPQDGSGKDASPSRAEGRANTDRAISVRRESIVNVPNEGPLDPKLRSTLPLSIPSSGGDSRRLSVPSKLPEAQPKDNIAKNIQLPLRHFSHDFASRTTTSPPSLNNLSHSAHSFRINDKIHDHDPDSMSFTTIAAQTTHSSKEDTTIYLPLIERLKDVPSSPSLYSHQSQPVPTRTTIRSPHKPVPARQVFSRGAPLLYLPHLDNLLSQISPPQFDREALVSDPILKGKDKPDKPAQMFPPLDKLRGKTLDELHHNSALPPFYKDKNSILSSIITFVIGVAGSSAIANYYSLQGLYDGVQIFALVLSSVIPKSSISFEDKWRRLFLSTIPNILALNIPTKLTQSLIFLAVFMVISGLLLYRFHIMTSQYSPSTFREGLQSRQPKSSWGIIAVSFVLTVLYLPLSTLAVHGVLWSSDFWVVPNPYTNGTKPQLQNPLGPSEVWRDPLDFCFTTTMRRDEVNYAPVIVVMSAITLIFMTLWFPIRLMHTIRQSLPQVDPYTELGRKRSRPEMELEYQRLLERDQSPFGFLYKDFRRTWGTYKSVYLWAKLSALLIVAIISGDNCAFRNFKRETVDIVRQSVLTVSMLVWFVLQCVLVPFVDPVSNASEWTSRLNYLLTSGLGLCVALFPATNAVLNGVVLYIIYVATYGLDAYFAIIGTAFMRQFIKKITRRVDFSIDIFSPKLDLTSHSPHLRRRIWQESIGALILTDEACGIPPKQKIQFSEPDNFEWPPYLLNFTGSPGERHVENLKILREGGLKTYARALTMISGPEQKLFRFLRSRIQNYYIGPDCYWRPNEHRNDERSAKAFFGNAWWIPFPPTLVIRYDGGGQAILDSLHQFENYVSQNEDPLIRRKVHIRAAVRALDGQVVHWPYTHIEFVGSKTLLSKQKYAMQSTMHFRSCVFSIKHQGIHFWNDLSLGSGFGVEMVYTKDIRLDGDAIGLDDNIDLTPSLAKFLRLNYHLIQARLDIIQQGLDEYRQQCREEAERKEQALSYQFLTRVYNWPLEPAEAIQAVEECEHDLRVRQLFAVNEGTLVLANQRAKAAGRSEVTVWWYLFWDDFWRRNHETITALHTHERDFNPHFVDSIAYRPLPRPALAAFLIQRGMLSIKHPKAWQPVHQGFLNKLYFRLNQIAFHNTDKAILVHVGHGSKEMDLNDLELTTHVRSSSMGTGGGTDLDDASIRVRPTFKWEDVLEDPMHHDHKRAWRYLHWRSWRNMLGVWFGITPLERKKMRTQGLALDVILDTSGRYVMIEH